MRFGLTAQEPGGNSMPFPVAERMIFESNPLDEVICQVKFPPLLKIDADPANFQERVRAEYPNYEAKPAVKFSGNIPPQLAELLGGELPLGGQKSHNFASRDEVWAMTLARNFLALTSKRYELWDEFRRRFETGLQALQQEYQPSYFNRIGLRYQDVIDRRKLGLGGRPWSELLKPAVTGPLGSPQISADVSAMETTSIVNLPDSMGKVQIKYALLVKPETDEATFLIDSDFFTDQQLELGDVLPRLDAFNEQARNLFHWCITPVLRDAMRPRPVRSG